MALVEKHSLTEAPEFGVSEAMPGDFIALLKPRVMSLVVFTAFVGMATAPGMLDPVLAIIAIVAIAVGAGASGSLNMWYDADIDAVMSRTAKRPVPAGLVTPHQALAFGIVLAVLSVMTLGLLVDPFAGVLLAFTIFFYAVIYTIWLKRLTPQNIVIGGAAGAFPPMIGWAAVTGSVSIESIVLFLIIFLWTPPHFWALALFKSDDYGRAGVPMLPNVAGEANTKRQIFVYSLLVAAVGVAPWIIGQTSFVYGIAAIGLGAAFVWHAWNVLRMPESDRTMKPAKSLFGYSLVYLFAIFAILLGDVAISRLLGL